MRGVASRPIRPTTLGFGSTAGGVTTKAGRGTLVERFGQKPLGTLDMCVYW